VHARTNDGIAYALPARSSLSSDPWGAVWLQESESSIPIFRTCFTHGRWLRESNVLRHAATDIFSGRVGIASTLSKKGGSALLHVVRLARRRWARSRLESLEGPGIGVENS